MPVDDLENHVRDRRRARRMTQAELAAATGVSRQTIISIEGGNYAPSVYLALRIAATLGSSVDALFAITAKEDLS